MVKKHGTGKVDEAYGKTINKEYEYDWTEYENMEEVKTEWSEKDLVELASEKNKLNEKSKAYQAVIAPYKPDPKDPLVMRKSQIDTFVKMGVPREIAEQQVDAILAAAAKAA